MAQPKKRDLEMACMALQEAFPALTPDALLKALTKPEPEKDVQRRMSRMTPADYANLHRVSVQTVYNWARSGHIRTERVGPRMMWVIL